MKLTHWIPLWALALTFNLIAENKPMNSTSSLATVGGGCFWCVEAVYQTVPGVKKVISGYAGGKTPNPTYEQVCSGQSGHAEVVQIEFDPAVISYEKVIDLFWQAHDPTTLNRQGADTGTQYRSIILYQNETEKIAAEKSKANAASLFKAPIVTEITPLTVFYPAEAYHQDYYANHPNVPYVAHVIKPKLEKFKKSQP